MCSSGVGFNPVIDGRRYTFEITGLYNAVMIMDDRETGSTWSHLDGRALDGPMQGAQLEIIATNQTSWEKWVELHPDTLVLSNNTPYQSWYGRRGLGTAGFGPEFLASIVDWDDRLEHNRVVLGVVAGGASRAYPVDLVVAAGGVVNDTLGGLPIVVVVDGTSAFSTAYAGQVDGQLLHFRNVAGEGESPVVVDEETGTTWDAEGQAIAGPLQGQSLRFVTSFLTEWYGWAAYHPGTEIFSLP